MLMFHPDKFPSYYEINGQPLHEDTRKKFQAVVSALGDAYHEILNQYGFTTRPLETVEDLAKAIGVRRIEGPDGKLSDQYLKYTTDGHLIPYPPTIQQWNAFQLRAGREIQTAFTDEVAKTHVTEGCQTGYVETAWDGFCRTESE